MIGLSTIASAKARAVLVVAAVAGAAAVCAGIWTWGLQVGAVRADARHADATAQALRQAADDTAELLRLGNRHATDLIDRLRDAGDVNARLAKELAHVPRFLVRLAQPVGAECAGPGSADRLGDFGDAGRGLAGGLHGLGDGPAPAAASGAGDGGAVRLSLAAVRMWNSALAGADVPAGACGTDAAPEAACAADSGVTFAAAYDNAVDNHARFGECVSRLNAWIDLEEARQARMQQP